MKNLPPLDFDFANSTESKKQVSQVKTCLKIPTFFFKIPFFREENYPLGAASPYPLGTPLYASTRVHTLFQTSLICTRQKGSIQTTPSPTPPIDSHFDCNETKAGFGF